MPNQPRIFISYAHRDGGELAACVHRDLTAAGFDAWRNVRQLLGGDCWDKEIEGGINGSDAALALLSDGSFTSDTCRAEQGLPLSAALTLTGPPKP